MRGRGLSLSVLLVLGAIGMLGPFGSDAYLVALPTMAVDLNSTLVTLQFSLWAYALGMAFGQLAIGSFSDRIGRRRALITGTSLVALGATVNVFASSGAMLIIACAVMGIGSASGLVTGRAVVSDLASGVAATRGLTFLGLVTALGPMFGPLGGILAMHTMGWRSIFGGIAVVAVALTITIALLVPESLPPERRQSGGLGTLGRLAWEIVTDRLFITSALVFWSSFGALFAYISASSFVVQVIFDMPPEVYTAVFVLNAMGAIAGGAGATILSRRLSARMLMNIGIAAQTLGALYLLTNVLLGTLQFVNAEVSFFLIVAGSGMVFGPSSAVALTHQRLRAGTTLAIMGFTQWVFGGLASFFVAVGGEKSASTVALVICGFLALAVMALWLGRSRSQLLIS